MRKILSGEEDQLGDTSTVSWLRTVFAKINTDYVVSCPTRASSTRSSRLCSRRRSDGLRQGEVDDPCSRIPFVGCLDTYGGKYSYFTLIHQYNNIRPSRGFLAYQAFSHDRRLGARHPRGPSSMFAASFPFGNIPFPCSQPCQSLSEFLPAKGSKSKTRIFEISLEAALQ